MRDTQLTPSGMDVLKRLADRETMGTCYLVPAGRGRWALVVPELRVDGPLARLAAYSPATIRKLTSAGLIEHGETSVPLTFRYRERLDGTHGETVALTGAGRAALPDPAKGRKL